MEVANMNDMDAIKTLPGGKVELPKVKGFALDMGRAVSTAVAFLAMGLAPNLTTAVKFAVNGQLAQFKARRAAKKGGR
jgi:hypothetical protein